MGCFSSKDRLTKEDMEFLKSHTRYDEATIKEWYKGFKVRYVWYVSSIPSHYLSMKSFSFITLYDPLKWIQSKSIDYTGLEDVALPYHIHWLLLRLINHLYHHIQYLAARLSKWTSDTGQVCRYVQDVLPIGQCRGVLRSCLSNIRYGQEWLHRFQGK